MKNVFAVIIGSVMMSALIIGCSSQPPIPESKEINITTSEVYGDDADVVSIIPNTYTLKYKEGEIRLKVKLRLEQTENRPLSYAPELILKDEDGVEIVDGWYQMEMSDSEKSKFEKFVQSPVGTEAEFVLVSQFSADYFRKAMTKSEVFSLDKLKFETPSTNEVVESTSDIVKSISDAVDELEEDFDDEDLDETIEQTKELMKMSGEMLNMIGTISNMLDE